MEEVSVTGIVLDNKITWAMIISGIALLTSIVSPIITSLINNHYQTKIKEKEFSHSIKVQVFNEYIEMTSREILIAGLSEDYNKVYTKIFLYAPKRLWNDIEKLYNQMVAGKKSNSYFCDKKSCQELLIKITKELNKEL